MRLDDTFAEQRLSLDMTPLIDVVFLLVLFFAVSTSFISPKALKELKVSLFDLGEEKQVLLGTLDEREQELSGRTAELSALEQQFEQMVAEREAAVAQLSRSLAEAAARRDEMQWKIDALAGREAGLEKTLAGIEDDNRTLAEQLEQAYRDFQGVNVALAAEKETSAARAADNERLLARIAAQIEAATRARSETAARLASQTTMTDAARARAKATAEAATRAEAEAAALFARTREQADARERLLQALIDEKAAALAASQQAIAAGEQALAVSAEELAAVRQQRLETHTALAGALDEAEQRAAEEALLRNLLAEKAAENETLARRIAALDVERGDLASALASAEQTGVSAAEAAASADARLAALGPELDRLRTLASLDDEQIRRLLDAQAILEQNLGEYIESQSIGIRRDRDRLTLQLSDQILFDSGSATIKPQGLPLLERVGQIVAPRLADLELQIGGHTDNVPLSGGGRFADNWSLSAARAVNVVEFMEKKVGLDASRLSAVGFGEHRPVAGNDSPAGRAQNRRIEIVLVPR